MNTQDEHVVAQRRADMRKRSREEAEAILRLAGFQDSGTWELANGYWPLSPTYDDHRTPWWLFMTEVGLIRIGRRKNVISIDWGATSIRAIVTQDEVTKAETYVHAWSVEKAITYLRALNHEASSGKTGREAASAPTSP